jgi:PPK2 family polyphosphate:nucleotide phosphotransferase
MLSEDIVKAFRVKDGSKFRLDDVDPKDTLGLDIDKNEAKAILEADIKRLRDLQERLYADARWSLLVIFQAMDAAGKDSAIEHVMSGVNPQGCQVSAFKAPSQTELKHDFLWRTTCALPERGRIGIFNRSYYEEVLVVRVHPELLAKQFLPVDTASSEFWDDRYESIRDLERHLTRNGTAILKFFLHVSKDEQRKRFLHRIDEPDKRWKFSAADVVERQSWEKYMSAYEEAVRNTATKDAPWHVVPADNKWFTRLVVAGAIVERLTKIDPQFPKVDSAQLAELDKARALLTGKEVKGGPNGARSARKGGD